MSGSHLNPGRPTGPVLVTGAYGTIGRRLVPALVAAGHQVRAMTRSDAAAQAAAAAGAEPVHGDVTDPASLSAADTRARRELRYQPVITRQQGLQRLRDAMRATVQAANPGV
jgi:uncharacterized protein YbjT (DUF2867 family)